MPSDVLHVGPPHSFGVVPHQAPASMVPHEYASTFTIDRPLPAVWTWLNDPATFVDGQVWPYRVEFVSPDPAVPAGFHVGVLNTHHGPGLNFAGVITNVQPMAYRDLRYFYGSYALSPRLLRPTRLQFWTQAEGNGTQVRLQIDSFVRRGWDTRWTWMQNKFWTRFPKWMRKGIDDANR